jgi:endonuclease YncB( thermonuclease family)
MKILTLGVFASVATFISIQSAGNLDAPSTEREGGSTRPAPADLAATTLPVLLVSNLTAQDPYGGGSGGGGFVYVGPTPEEMERARQLARAKSARISAQRKERMKRLAEARNKAPKPEAPAVRGDARAASLVRMGGSLEKSNRGAAVDYYMQALKAAPESVAGEDARKRLEALGVDPEIAMLPAYRVVRVLDGGTIAIREQGGEEETVRLAGVRAPKPGQAGKKGEPLGAESAEMLKKLIGNKPVAVKREVTEPNVDAEGRALVFVYRMPDGLLINQAMLGQGLGRLDEEFPFEEFAEFEKHETRAREAKRGLWNAGPKTVKGPR